MTVGGVTSYAYMPDNAPLDGITVALLPAKSLHRVFAVVKNVDRGPFASPAVALIAFRSVVDSAIENSMKATGLLTTPPVNVYETADDADVDCRLKDVGEMVPEMGSSNDNSNVPAFMSSVNVATLGDTISAV